MYIPKPMLLSSVGIKKKRKKQTEPKVLYAWIKILFNLFFRIFFLKPAFD